MNNENPFETLGIYLKMIQDSPQTWSINKSLAFKLSFNQMMPLGDFLKDLSDADLDFLMRVVDRLNEENEDDTAEFMLLSFLLSYAEGIDITEDANEMSSRSNILAGFIVAESMARKGLVELTYENMSLSEDSMDLIVIKPTQKGIELYEQIKNDPEAQ